MLVRDYMTPHAPILRCGNTIREAAMLFRKYRVDAASVLDETGHLCGIVTTSDLINAIIDEVSLKEPVSLIMTKNVISVMEDDSIDDAFQIPVKYLPVLTADENLVGMITARNFLEAHYAQMQQATDEVQALIRSAQNGIIVVNAYGIVTTFNESAARIVGVTAEAAMGRPIHEVISDSGLRRVLETGQAERGCHLVLNGRTVFSNRSPIFEGRKIVGALAIIQDTSELLDVLGQLSDAQNRVEDLVAVFENARQGIIVVDKNGVIVRVNRSYEETFNVCREDLIGKPVEDFIEDTRLHVVPKLGFQNSARFRNTLDII